MPHENKNGSIHNSNYYHFHLGIMRARYSVEEGIHILIIILDRYVCLALDRRGVYHIRSLF